MSCEKCGPHLMEAVEAKNRLAELERLLEIAEDRAVAERERANAIENDLALSIKAEIKLRRELQAAQRERRRGLEDAPDWPVIEGLLRHWQRVTGHGKAKVPADGARAELVRKALKTHSEDEIREALDGLGAKPFAGKRGRSSERYAGSTRYDDVEHALRDEVQLGKARLLWEESPFSRPPVEELDELRDHILPGLRLVVRTLNEQMAELVEWQAQERAELELMRSQLDQVDAGQQRFGVAA